MANTTKWVLLGVIAGALLWLFNNGAMNYTCAAINPPASTLDPNTARIITFGLATLLLFALYYFSFEKGPSRGFFREGGKFVLNPFQK